MISSGDAIWRLDPPENDFGSSTIFGVAVAGGGKVYGFSNANGYVYIASPRP